jgi:PhnB protein
LASIALSHGRLEAGGKKHKIKGDEMTLTPYLLFDGHCHQAMEFYQFCFGGELSVTKVKDSPVKDHMPAIQQDKVLNARLRHGNLEISASDWLRPDRTPVRGNTVCLYLSGGTLRDLQALFGKLSDGADVTDPLQRTFFGSYGALNDKFGVRWMFQSDEKAAA